MKIISIISYLIIFIIAFAGCKKEDALVETDASFEILNEGSLYIKVPTTFEIKGSGQMFTVWTGDEKHVYTDTVSSENTGVSLGEDKNFEYKYNVPGEYVITCIASSYGSYGEKSSRDLKQKTIFVSDSLKSIKKFSFKELKITGNIVNDSIFMDVCKDDDITNVKAVFSTESIFAQVFVDGVLQESKVTANDFSNGLVYKVIAYDGSEKLVPVIINRVDCK